MLTFTPDSSNIGPVAYDEQTRQMTVEFIDGSTYAYSNVPLDVYEGFKAAPSAGSYFHRFIRSRYAYAPV